MLRVALVLVLCVAAASLAGPPVLAQQTEPFRVDRLAPGVARLSGDIGPDHDRQFKRFLAQNPGIQTLELDSRGGSVGAALAIAIAVYENRISTRVAPDSSCISACTYIFFAGRGRVAEGMLGVHQIYGDDLSQSDVQVTISFILELLNRFDTPPDVLTLMLRTPPDQVYVFSEREIREFEINTRKDQATTKEVAPRSVRRIAIFAGLDFYGDDLSSGRTATVVECAAACFGSDQCRAFTFNTNLSRTSAPNCYLKYGTGILDGNAEALSAQVLRAGENEPSAYDVGMIDPVADVAAGVDFPGNDLSSRPHASAISRERCRLACVIDRRCRAFSFVQSNGQCWLKSRVGIPVRVPGVVSGVKREVRFPPMEIIPIEN